MYCHSVGKGVLEAACIAFLSGIINVQCVKGLMHAIGGVVIDVSYPPLTRAFAFLFHHPEHGHFR
jgi:hypothetical protein